jgi:tetratricopeptide (TPR) repeat protein
MPSLNPIEDKTMTSEQIDKLWSIDDPATGLSKLQQALVTYLGSADELHTQICRALGLERRFDEAWAELAKISANPPEIVQVRIPLESGRLKNTSGDKEGARPLFQRALELALKAHFDYYAIDAAHMLGIVTSDQESIAWNENALKMAAASKDVRARRWRGSLLNNLGWTYHDQGEYSKALAKFKEAEAFQQENGNPVSIRISQWAVARCLRSLKKYHEALTILQNLIQFPEKGYVSEELGENLLALGNPEEAKPHFRRAYELLSKDPYLKEHELIRLQRLNDLGQ